MSQNFFFIIGKEQIWKQGRNFQVRDQPQPIGQYWWICVSDEKWLVSLRRVVFPGSEQAAAVE